MNTGTKSKPVRAKEKVHHLQVFVRVRPPNAFEKTRGLSLLHCSLNEVAVKDRQELKTSKSFLFDRVFDQNSTQVEVYNHVLKPAIEDILKGYNYTVFAYGQSGSGKSYTIAGDRSPVQDISWDDDPLCGLVPRALAHLFDELRLLQAECTIRVSHLEICNEEIIDLLSPTGDSSKLRLYEDGIRKGAVCVHGLEEEVLHTRRDLQSILQKYMALRSSSRSHTLFTATVHIKENSVDGDELVRVGKLCLVDLAGSEIGSRLNAADKNTRETGSANQSLLTLGRVITALVERAPHVPYRESKLTRLLRDSLSGRSKTSIIGTVSTAAVNLEETISTLEFVQRARIIVIRPELNPKLTKESLIKEYTEEIERLKRDLEACHTKQGVYLLNEDYTNMISDSASLEREISEKLAACRIVTEQLHEKKRLCAELGMRFEEVQTELAHTRGQLTTQLRRRDETQYLLDCHRQTEENLFCQAGMLMQVVDQVSNDLCALHNKLDCTRCLTCENDIKRRKFCSDFCRRMQAAVQDVEDLVKMFSESSSVMREKVGSMLDGDVSVLSSIHHKLSTLAKSHEKGIKTMVGIISEVDNDASALLNKAADTIVDTAALDVCMQHYAQCVLPSVQDVNVWLQSWRARVTDIYKCLEAKNLQQTAWITKSLNERQESILSMQEKILEEVKRRDVEKQRLRNLIHNLQERQHLSDEELLTHMAEMRLALRNYGTRGVEYEKILATAQEECGQETEDTIARNRCIIDDLICQQTTDAQLWVEFKCNSKQLLADLKEVLDQAKEARMQVQAGFTSVRRNVVELATSSITAWTQHHEHVQSDVCALSESLSEGLQKAVCATHQICAATGEQALSCAALVEQLQQEAPTHVESLLEQIESQCAHLSSVSSAISSSLQLAAEEVSFIAEDHVKYQPTGNTPVRKKYEYPHTLDATSPHDRILEEFRASRKDLRSNLEILNCSSEEEELSRQESNGTSSLPSTTSMDELESSPQNEASSTKAVSGSEPNLSVMGQDDKENIPAARMQSASKLPVKVAQSTKQSSCCKQILTPRN